MKNTIYISLFLFIASCSKLDLDRVSKVTTDDIQSDATSISIQGTVVDITDGGGLSYGHCWSPDQSPDLNDAHTLNENGEAGVSYTSSLDGLIYNTVYYVRSYTRSASDTTYGETKTFSISSTEGISVSLNDFSILSETAISLLAQITGLGSLKAQDYGICWSHNSNPGINDMVLNQSLIDKDTVQSFVIDNLIQDTSYYFRAFLNLDGNEILYSNEVSIVISDLDVLTGDYTVNGNAVTIEGDILSLGVLPVTDHGHCWSYETNSPTLNDNVLSNGPNPQVGGYDNTIDLIPDNTVTYFYRAYAVKENQIVYGEIKSFTL